MPIYEYQCDGCGEVFEVRQKMSDPAPEGHSCGAKSVKRVLSNTSFVLKGTGWYKTDYADKKPGSPESKKDGDKPPPDGGSKAESNAKPSDAAAAKAPTTTQGSSDAGGSGTKPPPKSGGKSKGSQAA